jgi:hypothetical protein
MTSNREAVEPGEGGLGFEGAFLQSCREIDALSLASRETTRDGEPENQIRERTLAASTIAFPHIPFQSVQHKNPRKQMVLANRQQNDCAISLPISRIKFLSTGENAYNPTRLRNNVHHGFDSRRSFHHPSPPSSPTAAMAVVVVMVVMVLGWSTIFWRHATI